MFLKIEVKQNNKRQIETEISLFYNGKKHSYTELIDWSGG